MTSSEQNQPDASCRPCPGPGPCSGALALRQEDRLGAAEMLGQRPVWANEECWPGRGGGWFRKLRGSHGNRKAGACGRASVGRVPAQEGLPVSAYRRGRRAPEAACFTRDSQTSNAWAFLPLQEIRGCLKVVFFPWKSILPLLWGLRNRFPLGPFSAQPVHPGNEEGPSSSPEPQV